MKGDDKEVSSEQRNVYTARMIVVETGSQYSASIAWDTSKGMDGPIAQLIY